MSTGNVVLGLFKAKLDAISDWQGVTYIRVPYVREARDVNSVLLDVDKRLNAWFISRTGVRSIKRGEHRKVATNKRIKEHSIQIRGFWSVSDDSHPATSSEEAWQELCDTIEEAFSTTISMGVTNPPTIINRFDMRIAYEFMASILCHTVTITLSYQEWLTTTYVS